MEREREHRQASSANGSGSDDDVKEEGELSSAEELRILAKEMSWQAFTPDCDEDDDDDDERA